MPYKDPAKRREYQNAWLKQRRQSGLAHDAHYRERNRQHVIDRKAERGNRCHDCGRVYPTYVLDFDHRGDEEKLDSVSALTSRKTSLKRIDEEIAKCDLVCANCHRERTHQRGYTF